MRSQHIRALTGVRFFAALWVVVYHSTRHNFPFLYAHHHDAVVAVSPLVIAGVRGRRPVLHPLRASCSR